jgi:hypothetical protein
LKDATKDFLRWDGVVFEPHVRPSRRWSARKAAALEKQNPGRHVGATVDGTLEPGVDGTLEPPNGRSGSHVPPIQTDRGGSHVPPISRLATGVAGGSQEKGGQP